MSKSTFRPSDHTFAICAYKESPYLEDCILSLKNQTIKSNIIMATSTPCEQTELLAEKYQIPLFVNNAKPGIGSDWNFAYDSTDTSLVTIAHQDDIYEPEYTSQMLVFLNQAKDPIIYFCGYFEVRDNGKIDHNALLNIKKAMLTPLKSQKHWSSKKRRRRILSLGSPICCPSVTYIKDKCGNHPFNTEYKCSLDWAQWESLSKYKGDFVYNPKPLMRHRIHAESETSTLIHDQTRTQEDYYMFQKFWPEKIAKLMAKCYSFSQKSNSV